MLKLSHTSRIPLNRMSRRAFTLVEILIVVVILGILAAIVVPQFSNASQTARENTLKDELRYLRTQIVVFKAQHRDTPPGYPAGSTSAAPTESDFVNQLTMFSSETCLTSAAASSVYKVAPYLQKMPLNPFNSKNTVKVVANGQALPAADDSTGWIYKPQTQEIIANSTGKGGDGVDYAKY